jgi:hypothetical protein
VNAVLGIRAVFQQVLLAAFSTNRNPLYDFILAETLYFTRERSSLSRASTEEGRHADGAGAEARE